MKYRALGYKLPRILSAHLFGDRRKYGCQVKEDDIDWIEYKKIINRFYEETQKKSIGNYVNNAGYKVLGAVDMEGLRVLEVGPGDLRHTKYWNSKPSHYVLVDLYEKFLEVASTKLSNLGIPNEKRITNRKQKGKLPSLDNEFDLIISFYSFEHLYPFNEHLNEMKRVLKPGGKIVGAIPAEGGLAWGIGRYFTTRRWFKKNTNINPDKIICWEHPTMSDEILQTMSNKMEKTKLRFWPLHIPLLDVNLVIKFIYTKI